LERIEAASCPVLATAQCAIDAPRVILATSRFREKSLQRLFNASEDRAAELTP
jgi:hypothetical protein